MNDYQLGYIITSVWYPTYEDYEHTLLMRALVREMNAKAIRVDEETPDSTGSE